MATSFERTGRDAGRDIPRALSPLAQETPLFGRRYRFYVNLFGGRNWSWMCRSEHSAHTGRRGQGEPHSTTVRAATGPYPVTKGTYKMIALRIMRMSAALLCATPAVLLAAARPCQAAERGGLEARAAWAEARKTAGPDGPERAYRHAVLPSFPPRPVSASVP